MRELGYGETPVKTRYTDYSVGCSKRHSLCLKYATGSMRVHVIYIQNSRRLKQVLNMTKINNIKNISMKAKWALR